MATSLSSSKRNRSPSVHFGNLASPSRSNIVDSTLNRSCLATPLLSPGASRIVMLSPSRTISESLNDLATKTGEELEKIWDIIGLDPNDRATQLSHLLLKFRECCEIKINEENELVKTYRDAIAENKQKIKTTSMALKEEVDMRKLKESSSMTLVDELASTNAILEGLQTKAESASKDLADIRAFLLESHQVLGLKMDPQWNDIESDLTSSRLKQFREKKHEMESELSSRTSAVIQLVQTCQVLMEELKLDAEIDGTDVDRRIAGSILEGDDGKFTMTSKLRSKDCVGISSQAIEELTMRSASLQKEKELRTAQLTEMGHEISLLWEKLRVPRDEQVAFQRYVKAHGLGLPTIQKGEDELERLRALKAEKISTLIGEARETILTLWNQTNTSTDARGEFKAYNVTDEAQFDDDLLWAHDSYIKTLKKRFSEMQPILKLIERREIIVEERIEYEKLQQQPDRFHQAGAKLTRQLMAEEKMAKRIKRELPKVTDMLEEKLKQWEDDHDEEFLYDGEAYSKRMEQQEADWLQFKDELEQERKRKKNKQADDPKEKYFHRNRPFAENRPVKGARGAGLKKAPSTRF